MKFHVGRLPEENGGWYPVGVPIPWRRVFVACWHFNDVWHWSLGVHFYPPGPNLELHLPSGFIRVGWQKTFPAIGYGRGRATFGIRQRYDRAPRPDEVRA